MSKNVLDRRNFRYDPLASVDSSCDIASGSSMVTVNAECGIDILELCNGVMQCDDCADETFETCNSFDCIGSKLYTAVPQPGMQTITGQRSCRDDCACSTKFVGVAIQSGAP